MASSSSTCSEVQSYGCMCYHIFGVTSRQPANCVDIRSAKECSALKNISLTIFQSTRLLAISQKLESARPFTLASFAGARASGGKTEPRAALGDGVECGRCVSKQRRGPGRSPEGVCREADCVYSGNAQTQKELHSLTELFPPTSQLRR